MVQPKGPEGESMEASITGTVEVASRRCRQHSDEVQSLLAEVQASPNPVLALADYRKARGAMHS